MEPNKILSANILDLIFDDRNKEYGAYELRVTYPERIKKSLLVVFFIAAVTFAGVAFANSFTPKKESKLSYTTVVLQDIKPEEKLPPPPPEPKKPEPVQTKTIQFTTPVMVNEDVSPLPTQDEIEKARVDVKDQDGAEDKRIAEALDDLNKGTGIIPKKEVEDPDAIVPIVQIQPSYDGDWVKFLTRNLNASTPVENSAPVGKYNVIIQFIVDKEGNVSDIQALTNYGFGMEQEAIRVLKKAKGWKPGIQNGHPVKTYHKQPITFIVED